MIVHCNMKFLPDEIQFLSDNELFTNRKLEIATCPVCESLVVHFYEKRKSDGKIFSSVLRRRKAKRLLKECASEVTYSTLQIGKNKRNCLYGFRYGENVEKIDKKTGKKIIVQKSCDFYGNKETINTSHLNSSY